MNYTDSFVDLLHTISLENYPEDIRAQAKNCILDYTGVLLAGAYAMKKIIERYRQLSGSSIHNKALLYGMAAHYLELDDGSRFGMVHPGAPVISALLAAAGIKEMSGESFLRGVVSGYEATLRLAGMIQPGHKIRGFHATGTCGTVGAAVAIAAACEYTREELKDTVSAAVASAAGLLEVIGANSDLKPYNAGRAAMDGLTAAFIGKTGVCAPDDILGGSRGFLALLAEEIDDAWLNRSEQHKYTITGIYRKAYASCRHCHAPVEAAIGLREEIDASQDSISSVNVKTYRLAVKGHDHTEIKGMQSAKMSIPFSVAAALIFGTDGTGMMTEEILQDQRVLALTQKVSVEESDDLSALVPDKRAAVLTLTTNEGEVFSKRVDYPKGEPENPMANEELEEKFCSLALFAGRSFDESNAIISMVTSIENGKLELPTLLKGVDEA
ncbi:MAG: MmgE/PrpD family protein [Coriobacteriia bacterium]|nr:MmgE/PrpD family protein [Coriobacteriia bacterium]